MTVGWRSNVSLTITIAYLLPLLVVAQDIPACFQQAASKQRISCSNENLRNLDSSVYSRISPPISKSTITLVQLINCSITNLDFLDSDYLRNVKYVYLEGLKGLANHHLRSLVPHVSLSIVELTIQDHPTLTSIDELIPSNTFNGEWVGLDKLRVKNNALESIDRDFFAKIKSPSEYDLSLNSLRTLDLSAHKSVLQAKTILLNSNRLGRVEGLADFTELEQLDLSHNQLTNIDNFVTSVIGGGKLRGLYLSHNLIESFEPAGKSSTENSNLVINLQNNKLRTISDLGEGVVKNVYELNLSENKDLTIRENTFKGLERMRELRLSNCGITGITSHLQNLPSLSVLHLDNNQIGRLSEDTFRGTEGLTELSLKGNNLQKLEFISSETSPLHQLVKLDISLNLLDSLESFVAAPALRELRMDGSNTRNGFGQLSSCDTLKTLPSTLKIVCARDIKQSTVRSCKYNTFITLVRNNSKIRFNNDECCDNPTFKCDARGVESTFPEEPDCKDWDTVCGIVPIIPGVTSTSSPGGSGNSGEQCKEGERKAFQNLHDSEKIVIAIGYILAIIFLVMVIILFLRRYRSYDKWLTDHQERSNGFTTVTSLPTQIRKSTDTLDSVDGRRGSPKVGGNGTLQLQKGYMSTKSFDDLSMASGISQYSGTAGKSPFAGRKKFKDANSIDLEEESVRYTPQSQRKIVRPESGEESPTAMSVYSYASHQPGRRRSEATTPPTERRRHRSGGAVQRLRSNDLLDELLRCDEDLVPPQIQVVLQRKATERRKNSGTSPLVRNTRAYNTAPYRTKGKAGVVKKTARSPMLSVNKLNRVPRRSSSSMNQRALPDLPLDSTGSSSALLSAASSFTSNRSQLSNGSFPKTADVFDDEPEYHETERLTAEEKNGVELLDV